MQVRISVCGDDGWKTVVATAPDGSDQDCYALPKSADLLAFWQQRTGHEMPSGMRAMIWETVHEA